MSIQWTLVATILYAEIFVVLILLVPFISPQRWMRLFKSRLFQTVESHAHIYFNVFIVVLALLFVDSIREVRKYSAEHKEVDATMSLPGVDVAVHMKLFRAQRNFYIAGMALFLWLVIRRLVTLISNLSQQIASSEAAMSQAKSASAAAQRMLDTSNGENRKNEAEEKIQKELQQTKNELQTVKKDFDTMKKQSESTNREYDRLLSEYGKLEKKFAVTQSESSDKKGD